MKKIVFIGSVDSSDKALRQLIEDKIDISLVCSLNSKKADNVSDYNPIHLTAEQFRIPYIIFDNINEPSVITRIKEVDPDYMFVVGISQLLKEELLSIAKKYTIGFHPTPIPHNRGRAVLPWQIILDERESAVTFFRIDKGMDSGDILFREKYKITPDDYVTDVYEKVLIAMTEALHKNIYMLLDGKIIPEPQNDSMANYLLIRRPYDGIIDWSKPTEYILKIIRATSHPYPGAYAYLRKKKITIYRAEKYELNTKYIGYNGQVAEIDKKNDLIVLTTDGSIKITEFEIEDNIKVFIGSRLIGAFDAGIHRM